MEFLIYMAIGVVFISAILATVPEESHKDTSIFMLLYLSLLWPFIALVALGGWLGKYLSARNKAKTEKSALAPHDASADSLGAPSEPTSTTANPVEGRRHSRDQH